MVEDQRRCRSGEDRISGLPDELLHEILVRLGSAAAAGRTSVLSRRWRHVWAHLPELRFNAPRPVAPASFINTVDAALGSSLAPTLEHLGVTIFPNKRDRDLSITDGRIASLLHFAAEHVVGELFLCLLVSLPEVPKPREEVLEFPVCEKAKRIELYLQYAHPTWVRPQTSGLFTALTCLKIDGNVHMEGSNIAALVNKQCPCLRDLSLSIYLIVNFDVSIHSNSLRTLVLVLRLSKTRRLEIMAPGLEELTVDRQPMEAHISAPKLVKVTWNTYYPHLHRFLDVGRTLRQLKTSYPESSSLTKRFDEVDDLDLNISFPLPDVATHGCFLNETNKLPKCKSFSVSLPWKYHSLMPIMLHLLRSCNGTKKLRVQLSGCWSPAMHSCPPSCACHLEESFKIDGIDLSSLEEIEIVHFLFSHDEVELVEFLSSNAGNLKRLIIIIDRFCHNPNEKVHRICHPPNVKVEYYEFHMGRLVPLTES